MNITKAYMKSCFPKDCHWMAGDADYWCPTPEWMKELKNRAWRDRVAKNLMFWKKYNDCDNHAHHLHDEAMDKFAGKPMSSAQSPALGECWYAQDKGGLHAINFVHEQYDGLSMVHFIEPQRISMKSYDEMFMELTDREQNSIYEVRI